VARDSRMAPNAGRDVICVSRPVFRSDRRAFRRPWRIFAGCCVIHSEGRVTGALNWPVYDS
jgi:hypothetical protein